MDKDTTIATRFADVRAKLGITGSAYASALNNAAKRLGFEARWTESKISQTENGRRSLSLEDLAVTVYLDPARRSWHWIAFGRELPEREKTAQLTQVQSEELLAAIAETQHHGGVFTPIPTAAERQKAARPPLSLSRRAAGKKKR